MDREGRNITLTASSGYIFYCYKRVIFRVFRYFTSYWISKKLKQYFFNFFGTLRFLSKVYLFSSGSLNCWSFTGGRDKIHRNKSSERRPVVQLLFEPWALSVFFRKKNGHCSRRECYKTQHFLPWISHVWAKKYYETGGKTPKSQIDPILRPCTYPLSITPLLHGSCGGLQ